MADAASVLGTPVATVDTPGTAMIPLSDPGSSVNVTTPPPTDVQTVGTPGMAMVAQPTQWTPPQPGQVDMAQSPQPDAEIATGAVHQNWLARILDSVGTILGGDKTIVATKHPDGSVSVEHNPSTTGEKWGRIAQAALGGAARGMAAGQGPGGAGKAFAAGTVAGLAQPQQNLQQANQEAAAMNAQQLAAANHALLDQQRLAQIWENKVRPEEYAKQQEEQDFNDARNMQNIKGAKLIATVKNRAELANYGAANPDAVSNHLGVDGGFTRILSHGDGSADIWSVPGDVAKQLNPNADSYTSVAPDPDNPGKFIKTAHDIAPNTHTYGEIELAKKANDVQNNTNIEAVQKIGISAQEAANKAAELAGKQPLTDSQITRNAAEANRANAEAQKARATLPGLPGGTAQPIDDPNYPPAANFDPGTPGINPKKIGVIPADSAKAARLSRNIQHNGQIINDIVTRRPDLVGTINSLGTNWQQKVTGTNDPDLAALDGAVDQLSIASAGAHGSRAAGLVEGIHDGVLNHFKNGPAAVKAYTQGQMNSVQTFIDEENGYRHYGDPVGPNTVARARAIARAPGGAPAATAPAATGTPAANTSQAARQIPQGAQIGRDSKTGQALGYRLNGVWTPF
jgi:hypothetical protein